MGETEEIVAWPGLLKVRRGDRNSFLAHLGHRLPLPYTLIHSWLVLPFISFPCAYFLPIFRILVK